MLLLSAEPSRPLLFLLLGGVRSLPLATMSARKVNLPGVLDDGALEL